MQRTMMRLAVGVFATVLVAAGLVAGGISPALATNDPYVLAASDISCDATAVQGTNGQNPTATKCQQGYVAASFDPNTPDKPTGHGGAGYFTTGVYGSVPKRILIPGDVQYNQGWSDAFGCGSSPNGVAVRLRRRAPVGRHELLHVQRHQVAHRHRLQAGRQPNVLSGSRFRGERLGQHRRRRERRKLFVRRDLPGCGAERRCSGCG
jgi:hypothetical protein